MIKECYDKHLKDQYEWGGIFEEPEGVSAYKRRFWKRPMGRKLRSLLQRGDIIMIDKPDRMFRSLADFAITQDSLISRGVDVYVLDLLADSGGPITPLNTASPMGKIQLQVMIICAELESMMRSNRIKSWWREKRARGLYNGPRKGYCKGHGGLLAIDHEYVQFTADCRILSARFSQHDTAAILHREWCLRNGREYKYVPHSAAFECEKWTVKKNDVRKALVLSRGIEEGKEPLLEEFYDDCLKRAKTKWGTVTSAAGTGS